MVNDDDNHHLSGMDEDDVDVDIMDMSMVIPSLLSIKKKDAERMKDAEKHPERARGT